MTRRPALVGLGAIGWFLLAPGSVAGLVPYWLTGWRIQEPLLGLPAARVVGAVLALAGLASLVECFVRFAVEGLGTPAPVASPTRLVASGQYRHVRNPMYIAIVTLVTGEALVLGSTPLVGYAAGVWLVFHIWVIVYEEPTLHARFGSSFEAYRRHVRRWLPRFEGWEARGPVEAGSAEAGIQREGEGSVTR